jgi:hypothetical protein
MPSDDLGELGILRQNRCKEIYKVSMASPPLLVPQQVRPKYGFNRDVERFNGRAAMLGFIALVLIEVFTGHGLMHWLGLT